MLQTGRVPGSDVELNEIEMKHLQEIKTLYDEVLEKLNDRKLTPDFLHELTLKKDALFLGNKDEPFALEITRGIYY